MNSILILAFGTASGCFFGLAFARFGREKAAFYRSLVELCAHIESGICFKGEKIEDILVGAKVRSEALRQNINDYLAFIRGGEQLKLNNRLLSAEEKAEVMDFFSRLGTFDAETQLSELRRQNAVFTRRLEVAAHKDEKHGGNYIKLGSLFGLLFGILLI